MFLFGSVKQISVELIPAESAKKLPGFHHGASLKLTVNYGETVATMLSKFNQFRGPDSQIKILYDEETNTPVSSSLKITKNMNFIVI